MGKTLVINGADFSAVSIGKVELPRELSGTALAWIEASGNTGLTDVQKYAIDDFITAIGVDSVGSMWDKIDRLWLPMIAGDKAHSLVDYKNEYIDGYTSMPQTSKTSFDDNVSFANHGLKVTQDGSARAQIIVDSDYTFNSQDCSFFMFNSEDYATIASGQSKEVSGIGNISSPNNKRFAMVLTSSAIQIKFLSSTVLTNDTKRGFREPHLRGVTSNSTGISLLYSDGTFESSAAVESETLTGISILRGPAPYLNDNATPSYGAFIVGKYMTNENIATLRTALDTLFAAIANN